MVSMKKVNHQIHVLWSFIPTVVLGTLLSVTAYVLIFGIQSVSSGVFFTQETGERLGESTVGTVQVKESKESHRAYQYFCTRTNNCSIQKFCTDYPLHCLFPSGSTTPSDSTQIPDMDNETESYDTSEDIVSTPTHTPTPKATWCWQPGHFSFGFCPPNPTEKPIPSPSTASQVGTQSPAGERSTPTVHIDFGDSSADEKNKPKSWCYDTDGNDLSTRGVCRDADGTHYDSCSDGEVREFICQGRWNGREFVDQKCVAKQHSCSNTNVCQHSTCVAHSDKNKISRVATMTPPQSKGISPTKITQENPAVSITNSLTPQNQQKEQTDNQEKSKKSSVSQKDMQADTRKESQEGVSILPPSIIYPLSGTTLSGKTLIAIDTQLFSTVTILLQPVVSVDDRMYLGKVSSSGNKNIEWDTSLAPNGEYYLFAVAHKAVQKYISEPMKVIVKNESVTGAASAQFILPSKFNPETVPVDKHTSVSTIETETTETGQAVVMQGKAAPNTLISILIYSNPVVVTVKADANGVWKYTLEEPLDAGEHTAYVVVPQEDGSQVRSAINTFIVPPVYASAEDDLNLHQGNVVESNTIRNFVVIAVLLILDAIAILLFVYRMKNKKAKEPYVG